MSQRREKHAGPGRPRDEDLADRRRREIVRHAIEEFARNGFNGADLDAIAANAGCSKGTLYNYFESKGALFSASVDHVMFSLVDALGDEGDESDPVEQIERLAVNFLRHFAQHPQYVELLVQERADFKDRQEPTYYRYRETSRAKWLRRFEWLIAQGRMRPMPPERALTVMSDLLYGTIFMNHFRHRRITPERQAADVVNVLLGGLLTEDAFATHAPPNP
ncbi:MAG TPA: TetR/AcrR family transcriptional regulator [Tepidisphaeraceae bacterium]|jgi:AcrR family transcriptional regulator